MNDSLRTDVFVRFQPESIACACIYLAARTLEVSAAPPGAPPSLFRQPLGSFNEAVFQSQSSVPIRSLPLGDQRGCVYRPGNKDRNNGDGLCVYRSRCLTVPIGFLCLEQPKKKFKKSA